MSEDNNQAIDGNLGLFKPIKYQKLEDVSTLDCKIDVKDKNTKFAIETAKEEIKRFFYNDRHLIYIQIVQHVQEMLPKGLVQDRNLNVLNEESKLVVDFFQSDYVKIALQDEDLRNNFYKKVQELEAPELNGWTTQKNETKRKIYVKKEEKTPYINTAMETIVNANVMHMFAMFDNFDVLMELLPQIYEVAPVYKATDSKFIMRLMLDYPWPLSDRELIVHVTGVVDYTNKALLVLSSYKQVGETYFDYVTPAPDAKFPREQLDFVYHYFQYISPTQSRYTCFARSNAQFDFIPTWFINWMASTVIYIFLKILEKFSLRLSNSQDPISKYYDRKACSYDSMLHNVLKDQSENVLPYSQCPDHPANPQGVNYDENHVEIWNKTDNN